MTFNVKLETIGKVQTGKWLRHARVFATVPIVAASQAEAEAAAKAKPPAAPDLKDWQPVDPKVPSAILRLNGGKNIAPIVLALRMTSPKIPRIQIPKIQPSRPDFRIVPLVVMMLLTLILCALAASCGCWGANAAKPQCKAPRQLAADLVDCTHGRIATLGPVLARLLVETLPTLLAGTLPDLKTIAAEIDASGLAIAEAGCVFAHVEDDLAAGLLASSRPTLAPQLAAAAHESRASWLAAHAADLKAAAISQTATWKITAKDGTEHTL